MNTGVDWFWLYLSPRGRLTRVPYLLAFMLVSMLLGLVVYRYLLAYYPGSGDPWQTPGLADIMWTGYLVTLWPLIAITAKRAQDIGLSPFLAAAIAMPIISPMAFVAFCLIPGEPRANRFGDVRNEPPSRPDANGG